MGFNEVTCYQGILELFLPAIRIQLVVIMVYVVVIDGITQSSLQRITLQ